MADLAVRVTQVQPEDAPLIGAAAMLLLVVFGLKAAMFPLYFWLPRAYASATAPVAALFAIMTKVGLYSILRVYTLLFGEAAGDLAQLVNDWLWPAALITVALGAIGALAASTLSGLVAYLVVLSVGILLSGIAIGNQAALTAALYYLAHSTWISGALFLMAGILGRMRGPRFGVRLLPGPKLSGGLLLSGIFFIGAISVVGMPPLSGFIGKVLLLGSAGTGAQAGWLYATVLASGLLVLIALSRAGSTLFWRHDPAPTAGEPLDPVRLTAMAMLLLSSPLMVLFAAPLLDYLDATARQLLEPSGYIDSVLSTLAVRPGAEP